MINQYTLYTNIYQGKLFLEGFGSTHINRNLPIYDGWRNPFRVYCGEACNDTYRGVEGCDSGHFMVVSFSRDGEKEDWEYDRKNSAAGLYELKILDDFDKDIVRWNGSFVRAPRPERKK